MSVLHNAMRHTPPYSCLQVPAEKGQPHSASRSIPELEATFYPSVCFNAFIQIRSAQLSYPLALIMSVPDSLPTMGFHIPLYGALWGPITWQPDYPGSWPHRVKIILVCCRHPWSCHTGPTLKWKAGSHEDELHPHSQTTQHTSCTCFHYSSHKQACYSARSSQAHQVHWWLDKGVPRSVQGNWQIPWWIQNPTPSWCPSCDTCPQEMPHHLMSKGQGAPQQDGMPRCDHPCRWTNGLGILNYLHPEGKWQAMSVLGSLWPQ